MDRERIEQRLAELRAQLVAYVEAANRQVAALEGGIAVLEGLLADDAANEAGDVARPNVEGRES